MLSNDRKNAVLQALYAAASDPGQHETFIDHFSETLAEHQHDTVGSWLEPHIETATAILEKLNFAGLLEKSSTEFVNRFSGPACIVNSSGAVIASNVAWSSISPASSIFQVFDLQRDQSLVRSTLTSLHTILEDRVKMIRFEEAPPGLPVLSFQRLPTAETQATNSDRILVRTIGVSWPPALVSFLRNEFALTETEIQTARSMVEGATLAEIGSSIDRTREAVKSHTKSIYAKMGISGREDLVRLILQLHHLLGEAKRPDRVAHDRREQSYVSLSDGRRVHWVERGAPAGRRLLFVHGVTLGHQFSNRFEDLLAKNNLTLICIDRPGYGKSDPPREWRKGLEEWIDLFPELTRALDVEGAPLVTQTGGVMLASAAAAHHPKRVPGVCAFAGGVPILDRKKLSLYPQQVRLISMAARMSPAILRFLIMNAANYFKTPEGRERMIQRTYANTTVDREALRDPEIFKQVGDSMELIADGGFDGFVADNLHLFGDWSRFSKRARCEIAYLNGSEDKICPVAWTRDFAETVENVTVSEAVGAGYLMLHTHPERCMEHLLDCLDRFDSAA